jgi:hypothetical protein
MSNYLYVGIFNKHILLFSYVKLLECCENSLEARPAFSDMKDYFVRLYNEYLRNCVNSNRLKNINLAFSGTEASCVSASYAMPDAILEQAIEPTT